MSVHAPRVARPAEPTRRPAPDSYVGLRAVVLRGLLDRRRSVLVWGGSLGAFGAFMAAIYPTIRSSIEQIAKSYPAGLKEAFGVQTMNTVEGYLHAELFSLIVPLAIGYYAVRAVAAPIAGAEERGELDTILSLPLSRHVLAAGSCIVAALTSGAVLALTGVMTLSVGAIAGTDISPGLVAAGCAGTWPLALFAGGMAAVAAGWLHGSMAVTGTAMGILVAMYALDLAGRMAHSLDALRYLSAFRYYGAPMRDGIDPAAFVGLTGAAIMLMVIGAVLLDRRDVLH